MSYIKNLEESVRSVLNEDKLADEAAEFLGIEPAEAEARVKDLDFVEYVELAHALQMEDEEIVRSILELPVEEAAPLIGMAARAAGAAVGKAVADKVVGEDELEEGFFDMFKRETRDEEVAAWVAALFTEWGRHKAADYIAGMEAEKRDFISGALDRYMADHPKGEFAPEVSWVIRGLRPLSEDDTECDLKLLNQPTMSVREIADKHGVPMADIASELAMGIKVELEHTKDRKIAKEIALDHLMELPDYYTRLDKMEKTPVSEAKAGPFKSPMLGSRVQIIYSKDAWGRDIEQGVEGTVTRAEREHTFSQMRPFVIVYTVETDDGQKIDVRREGVRKLKAVEEGDNPYAGTSQTMGASDDESMLGRKSVDDLGTGDDIEVVDIDGDPAAVTVKNANAPGDTLIVQTDKGEEHIVKKQAVSGTPTMEELHAAYEQALGEKGKWTRIKNSSKLGDKIKRAERVDKKKKLDHVNEVAPPGQEEWIKDRKAEFKKRYGDRWEEVLYATAWKRHNNESVEEASSEDLPDHVKGKADFLNIKIPVDINNKHTRVYLPRAIRGILKNNHVRDVGKTTISNWAAGPGVIVKIKDVKNSSMRSTKSSAVKNMQKDLYDKLKFAGYNVAAYPFYSPDGTVEVFVKDWPEDEPGPRWDLDEAADKIKPFKAMGYAPKAGSWKKRMHKAQPPENHEKTKKRHKKLHEDGWLTGVSEVRQMKPTRNHRPAIWENMLGTVFAMNDKYQVKGFDYDYEGARAFANLADKQDKRVFRMPKLSYRPHWDKSKDEYERPLMVPRKGVAVLWVEDTNRVKPAAPVEEGQNAGKTEHSGAKKGKGAYYGRKKDAKRDSNKKRRENDKKAVDETARLKKLAGIKETASAGATGAGAVAVGPVAVGDMQARPGMGIYDKPKRKKRKTKEEKGDGIGRNRKE